MSNGADNIEVLDLKGLNCPMPVLKTRKALRLKKPGEELWVETTDPLARLDIPAFCNEAAHQLVRQEEGQDCQRFLIRKGE